MAEQPLVSVRGEASAEVEPEIAVVSITVAAQDTSRQEAVVRLGERSAHLATTLDEFADAVEKTETSGVSIRPEFKDGKPRERVAGYVAAMVTRVTVHDLSRLGDLVARVGILEMTEIAGLSWQLRRDSPLYRATRVDAVRDAVRRAAEYAAALDAHLTGLVEVADTGLGMARGELRPFAGTASPARSSTFAGGPDAVLDLTPASQTVRAQVEARFTMSEPTLG